MITQRYFATEFYEGQGLGNQLWVYAFLRSISKRREASYIVKSPQRFKGIHFLDLDFGDVSLARQPLIDYCEQSVYDHEGQIHIYPEIELARIPNNCLLKGNFQSVDFIYEDFVDIYSWTKCRELEDLRGEIRDNTCILNVRGGDYLSRDDLLLYPDYWIKAMRYMNAKFGNLEFRIVTDDFRYAKRILPEVKILELDTHGDYFMLQNSPYLILSNSSFAFFPAWTNSNLRHCVGPKYWAGHNLGRTWVSPYNIVPNWNYIDRFGQVDIGQYCKKQIERIDRNTNLTKSTTNTYSNVEARLHRKYYQITMRNVRYQLRSELVKRISKVRRQIESKSQIILKKNKERFSILEKLSVKFKTIALRIPYNKKDKVSLSSYLPKNSIIKLRERAKVFDLFYFHNESEILRLRIRILHKYVDYFVIVESRVGFSGQEKTPFARKICAEFPDLSHKFMFVEIETVPESISKVQSLFYSDLSKNREKIVCSRLLLSGAVPWTEGENQWVREFYIKEYPVIACDWIGDGDAVFISDVDEIWNPHCAFNTKLDQPQLMRQRSYHYFLDNRSNEGYRCWSGTVLTNGQSFRSYGPNELRSHLDKNVKRTLVSKGGWHFTSQGSKELILEKFRDAEWLGETAEREDVVLRLIETRKSYRNERVRFKITKRKLPREILNNPNKYRHMLFSERSEDEFIS